MDERIFYYKSTFATKGGALIDLASFLSDIEAGTKVYFALEKIDIFTDPVVISKVNDSLGVYLDTKLEVLVPVIDSGFPVVPGLNFSTFLPISTTNDDHNSYRQECTGVCPLYAFIWDGNSFEYQTRVLRKDGTNPSNTKGFDSYFKVKLSYTK